MAQFSQIDLLREARRRGLLAQDDDPLLAEARRRGLSVESPDLPDQQQLPIRRETTQAPAPALNLSTQPTTISGEVLEVLKGIPSGAMGLLETAATGAAAILPSEAEQAVRKRIDELGASTREALAAAPGYEESIGRKAGEALGSTVPFFALGPLGTAGRVATAGLAAAAGAGEARQRAEQEGGMEDRGLATALGVVPGLMDVIPAFRFADRILERVPAQEKGLVLEYVKRAAAAGGEEFAQEAAQNITQNLIEKGIYNPKQDILEGAVEEGSYGFGVGAFIQGLTDLALGRRIRRPVERTGEEGERTRIGAEQTLAGTDTGGAELPVSRVGAERPDLADLEAAGVGIPRRAAERMDERAQGVEPALEPAAAQPQIDLRGEGVAEPDRVSQRIIESGAGSDFVRGLYEPDPVEATRNNFSDLDTVTRKEINQAKDYIKSISQNALQQEFGDEVTLYRGVKGTEDKTPVLSYSLDRSTAKFFAEQQGIRSGKIEEIKVPVSQVLSYSEAIGKGTLAEAEVLIANPRVQSTEDPKQGYAPKPPPRLHVDNPGGEWLQYEKEYAASRGVREDSGAPKLFGALTATYKEAPIYLPVEMLKRFRGINDEQNNVRKRSLDYLVEEMGKTGKLPPRDNFASVPFINVDQNGVPYVNEGNHRIMAAAKLGWEWLPVNVAYYSGGEQANGPLRPDRIKDIFEQYSKTTQPKAAPRIAAEEAKAVALPKPKIESVVNELTQGWANKPNIKVVQSYQDLPEPYRVDKYKEARGLLAGNDLYIVADKAGSESDVRSTLFHESLGHYGIRGLFRTKLDQVLDDIYRNNTAIKAAANSYLSDPRTAGVYQGPDRFVRAVEEILATKAEAGPIKEPGIRAAFNRVAALVRKFLRSMGVVKKYSDNDINNILREASARVRTNPTPIVPPNASPRFQISQYNKVLTNVLEQNEKLPEWSQPVANNVVNALSTMPEATRRLQYKTYTLPQITDLLEDYIPRVRAIDRYLGYRAAYTTDLMATASERHGKYTDVIRKNSKFFTQFNDVYNEINLYQVPVRDQAVQDLLKKDRSKLKPYQQKYAEVAEKFNALPEALQNVILSKDQKSGMYADFREMADKKLDIFEKTYGGQLGMGIVRDLRERFEKERLPMYAPLTRGDGNHWLYYETTDGRQFKMPFPNQAARELAIKKAIESGEAKASTVVRATRASELRDKGPPPAGFLGEVVKKLEETLKDVPGVDKDEIINGIYETFLNYLPSNMLRQELSSRQTFDIDGVKQFGVLGFDTDALAVYERTMPKMAYQLGNLKYALPLENAMKKITEQAKMYEINAREGNLPAKLQNRKLLSAKAIYDGVDDVRQRLNFAYNPSYAPWVNALATANYVYSIAGNVSSALINTTVIPMMVWPSLTARHGYVNASVAMLQAAKMFATGGLDAQGNFTFGTSATGEARQFYDYLKKRGVVGLAAEQELRQAQRAKLGGYQGLMDKINYVMGYVFKNSERFNRETTLLASFMLERKKGRSFMTAAENAIRLNNNINGTVLPEAASRWYQTNPGRVLLTFRTFALTQNINLARAFGRAINAVDATPEERAIARRQLLGVMGATYLVSGIGGLPLFGAAEALAAALMGDDDEPYDLQQEVLESLGELGQNGPLNALLKVDIASRTGFNNMFWRDDPKRLAELGLPMYMLERIAGPSMGLVQAQARGFGKIADGDVQRGLESMLPAPLRNPLKAWRYFTEGALTKDGEPIIDNVSTWNSAMQVFGFAPAELASAQEQITATFAISDKLRKRRTALLTNLYSAVTAGDGDAVMEVEEAIDKFNIANPLYMINSKATRASFRERQRRSQEAVNGIYLPRDLRLTLDQYMADIG